MNNLIQEAVTLLQNMADDLTEAQKAYLKQINLFIKKVSKPSKTVKLAVVFGEEAVSNLVWENKVSEAVLNGFNEYKFDTQAEANAFLHGIQEAHGWMEYHIPETKEINKIKRAQAKLIKE